MPINQKTVALNACAKISGCASVILDTLDTLEGISEQLNKANITLSTYDTDISGTDTICQANGLTYQIVASEVQAEIVRALKTFDSVATPVVKGWTAMQRVRR